MNIKLYNISDDPYKVDKSADKDAGYIIENVRFKDDRSLNILQPTLVLNLTSEVSDGFKWNYLYIPKTTRFYYITNTYTEGALFYIETRCDVLNSWKTDILNSSQYVARSQNIINNMLVDNLLPIHSDHYIDIMPFGDDVYDTSCQYVILETAGKGGVL